MFKFLQTKMAFVEYWRNNSYTCSNMVSSSIRCKNKWMVWWILWHIAKALAEPGAVTEKEFIAYLFTFAKIAAVYILVVIFSDYFTSHWTFRWRTAMANFYHDKWNFTSSIEGASQKVQKIHLNLQELWKAWELNYWEV